jgi:hypothetical protein
MSKKKGAQARLTEKELEVDNPVVIENDGKQVAFDQRVRPPQEMPCNDSKGTKVIDKNGREVEEKEI